MVWYCTSVLCGIVQVYGFYCTVWCGILQLYNFMMWYCITYDVLLCTVCVVLCTVWCGTVYCMVWYCVLYGVVLCTVCVVLCTVSCGTVYCKVWYCALYGVVLCTVWCGTVPQVNLFYRLIWYYFVSVLTKRLIVMAANDGLCRFFPLIFYLRNHFFQCDQSYGIFSKIKKFSVKKKEYTFWKI